MHEAVSKLGHAQLEDSTNLRICLPLTILLVETGRIQLATSN